MKQTTCLLPVPVYSYVSMHMRLPTWLVQSRDSSRKCDLRMKDVNIDEEDNQKTTMGIPFYPRCVISVV